MVGSGPRAGCDVREVVVVVAAAVAIAATAVVLMLVGMLAVVR